jgi:hypothetical protein
MSSAELPRLKEAARRVRSFDEKVWFKPGMSAHGLNKDEVKAALGYHDRIVPGAGLECGAVF